MNKKISGICRRGDFPLPRQRRNRISIVVTINVLKYESNEIYL